MMRRALIIVAIVFALLVLYVASFHLLVLTVGESMPLIRGTPGHLVHFTDRRVAIFQVLGSATAASLIRNAYWPLEWAELVASGRPLAATDPGARQLQEVLTFDALGPQTATQTGPRQPRIHYFKPSSGFYHPPGPPGSYVPPDRITCYQSGPSSWNVMLEWSPSSPSRRRLDLVHLGYTPPVAAPPP